MFYRPANDTKQAIHGKKAVRGYTKEGSDIGMDIQIADVKKTLGSVTRLCEAGIRLVFDDEGSYVENKHTGEKSMLVKERGSYVLSLWVERGPSQKPVFRGRERGHESPQYCKAGRGEGVGDIRKDVRRKV